jgi:hypothetical protein
MRTIINYRYEVLESDEFLSIFDTKTGRVLATLTQDTGPELVEAVVAHYDDEYETKSAVWETAP